ncbi:hypothetical protein EDC04DRAFT_2609630 [Pisolithus marmoratus]|nr:hypothetical protein EDC04DRAFT_2609630 [Pisolithus marmoratus]
MWAPPPLNTFSSRGRAQVEQPADCKGKQRQPSPLQVEPACPPMEDKITPGNLYANIPMTINELIIQGTMFPDFDGTELPYRVLHLGQGNDGVRSILFMRINDNLYTYGNEMIRKAIQWERDMMGPIALYNTTEEICKLLEMNEVMDLALKEWRPPIWASQKACQKREVLRDKERASQAQARHSHQGDLPPISIRDLQSHLDHKEGLAPLEKRQEGLSLSFHMGLHLFMPQSMTGFDKSSKLLRMFPGALGFSSCPNDDEVDINPPSQQDVQGFLLYELKGQYRALLEWAEVAPAVGTPVPWEGGFTHLATMANVATYLAANGIMYHNANDVLKWAQRAGNNNGGDKDPNTKAIINQMRAALNKPLPVGKYHSLEWIDLQAHVLGVLPENIVPYKVHPIKERVLFALEEFTKSAALYDLSHHARGQGSNAGGVILIPASTLKEGEMEDDLRPM